MGYREQDSRIVKLRKEGNTIWSYSKLGSFHNCKFAYKLGYIDKIKGDDNIYSLLGSLAHDILEEAYNTKSYDCVKAEERFVSELDSIIDKGFVFSKEERMHLNIYNNYVKSMRHFFRHFKLEEFKSKQEGLVLAHLFDNHYIQGYYDQIRNYSGELQVIDFKTSTEFKGADRDDKAKQLILYADILSKNSKHSIDKVGWYMLKYCKISYPLKNGKTKETIALRSEWVKKLEKQIDKDLSAMGMDDLEVNMYVCEAVANNTLEGLPELIQMKYKVEDYIDWYEYSEVDVEKVYKYIKDTIESIGKETEWKPNLESTYYCNSLCGYSKMCPYIAQSNEQFDEFDDLL